MKESSEKAYVSPKGCLLQVSALAAAVGLVAGSCAYLQENAVGLSYNQDRNTSMGIAAGPREITVDRLSDRLANLLRGLEFPDGKSLAARSTPSNPRSTAWKLQAGSTEWDFVYRIDAVSNDLEEPLSFSQKSLHGEDETPPEETPEDTHS